MNLRVAVIGPTGYTGLHLVQLLLRHPQADLAYLASAREQPTDLRDEFPQLRGRLDREVAMCRPIDPEAIADAADVAFLALPHRVAMEHVPPLLDAGVRVIDLSADYRLDDAELYEKVYDQPHTDAGNLDTAAYGLPELFRKPLAGATLVANPGCYPTAAALAIAPLLSHSLVRPSSITINATSGVTGAGRKASDALHFPEANQSFRAYGTIGGHRHQPEIRQTLRRVAGHDVPLLFVPHLLPVDAGILETIYLQPTDGDVTQADLDEAYADAYAEEPFVRRVPGPPNIKHVVGTNCCDLHWQLLPDAHGEEAPAIVVFSAIDNLLKGASGQAVQNMNAVFELDETAGLWP
jgi:N-acetyl-gamma-glutamyl-phosphate reductase